MTDQELLSIMHTTLAVRRQCNGVRRRNPGEDGEMTHKLDATVFVYRHRDTKEIKARYIEEARELDSSEEWAHVATLEPRMWIQYHYDDMIRERQLCADLCRSLAPSQRELNRAAYDFCNLCADEIERRGEVQEYRP